MRRRIGKNAILSLVFAMLFFQLGMSIAAAEEIQGEFSLEESEDFFQDDGSMPEDDESFFDDGEEENPGFSDTGEESGTEEETFPEETPEPEPGVVTLQVQDGDDITDPLNDMLAVMAQYATDEAPCKVIIPPGNYQLTGTIHMYSNLHLYAEGAVITKTSSTKHILLRMGNGDASAGGYDGYRNVTIEGGTWDCNYAGVADKESPGGFVGFRIGHASHVTIKNVTFLNNLKSHFVELAGVKDALVTGCTFRGYWEGYEGGGQECIQLDACLDYIFPGYEPFDGTACEDIVITGNTFENVFAGVGSHSMVFDRCYKNITISGNTFRNIRKRAVWCLYYIDSRVENNYMENVGGGILVNTMYLPNTHVLSGQNVTNAGNQQPLNVSVMNNTISISDTRTINGASWKGYGIQVQGSKVTANAGGVPGGIYRAKAVTVSGNRISGYGNGIRLFLADGCTVTWNIVSLENTGSLSNMGIYLGASSSNLIKWNTVCGCRNVGIYAYNGGASYNIASKCNEIAGNTVSNTGGDGILIEAGSTATAITGNEVTKSRKNGIVAADSKDCIVSYNSVSGCTLDGISGSKASRIAVNSNAVSANRGNGIRLMNLTAGSLTKNTITGNKKYGIYAESVKMQSMKSNAMEDNSSSYAIRTKNCTGIASLKKVQSNAITRKTTSLSGTAYGGKTVTVYVKKSAGNIKVARGKVDANGRYRLPVSRQKKNTILSFVSKDSYGNAVTASFKVQ